jgi:hypothetical protein
MMPDKEDSAPKINDTEYNVAADLVVTLREGGVYKDTGAAGASWVIDEDATAELCEKAADRIEQLEVKLSIAKSAMMEAFYFVDLVDNNSLERKAGMYRFLESFKQFRKH